RNQVPYGDCTIAGGWVDVATGKVIMTQLDFEIGGACPIAMRRVWFSSSGYLGPLGRGWHHAFDLALARGSDCIGVRLADGRVVWFPEPSAGGSYQCPNERLSLTRDHYGYVLRAADGFKHRFVSHRARAAYVLGAQIASDGRELRFGYDDRGRMVRITGAAELTLELEYDTSHRVSRIRAPHATRAGEQIVLVHYAYDDYGNLRKAVDALGQAERYGFERARLITRSNRNGSGSHFGWDARERCVHCWSDGGVCDRKLSYADRVTRVVDSLGQQSVYHHDGALVVRSVDACGGVRQLTRGSGRRIECEQDELGQRLRKRYDARGNLIELCTADGATWRFEYDARDRLLHAVDALGGSWRFEYGGGRLLSATDPLGNVRRYAYRGRWLVAVFEPDGRQTRFAYDAAGNLAMRVACDGTVTKYEYDAWGQLVALSDGAGNRQEHDYDLLGRLVRVRGPQGVCELGYDAESNLTSWRDGDACVRFTYQGTARLSSRKADGATLCFEYDSEEQLVSIVNEHGRVFRIARDARGAVREVGDFDGSTHSFTRDAAGRVVRHEHAGEFSEYEYDAAGRVIEVLHSDGSFEGYRHRADGSLESSWNQHSALELERDALGRILVERQGGHAVESQYDAAGRRTGIQSSLGMRQLLEYSQLGCLRTLSERASGFELRFERDALGLELTRQVIGGARGVWTRDTFGRPTTQRLELANGELQRQLEYVWDAAARLTRRTDSACGVIEYHYDGQGRLAWSEWDGTFRLRMPDAVGNVFCRDDRRDREYGACGELLTRSAEGGEVFYSYDAQGRLRERRHAGGRCWRFHWSASGMLSGVVRPDGSEVSFAYDALGRRIWKKAAGRTTRWLWDGAHALHEWVEDDASGAVTWLREPGSGVAVAQLTAAEQLAILSDCEATPICALGSTGPRWAAIPDTYGDLALLTGERERVALRWCGMYEDAETGLYCTGPRARYYDPRSGTYLSPDRAPPTLRAYEWDRDSAPCRFAPAVFTGRAACELTLRGLGARGNRAPASAELDAWAFLSRSLPAAPCGLGAALDRGGCRQLTAAAPRTRQPEAHAQLGPECRFDAQACGAPAAQGMRPLRPPQIVWLAAPHCVVAP
ncbi:MAG TPA: DUF6531 domain-containing protein, partial [Polyangiales bacterium]|nr:DUF6531 domain-containing protein [Polyangiales bacterium]